MKLISGYQTIVRVVFVLASGTALALSCTGVGEKVRTNLNPCGTIITCDPVEYDLLTTDYPDWNLDPTCTIPGQCDGPYPFHGTSNNNTTNTQ